MRWRCGLLHACCKEGKGGGCHQASVSVGAFARRVHRLQERVVVLQKRPLYVCVYIHQCVKTYAFACMYRKTWMHTKTDRCIVFLRAMYTCVHTSYHMFIYLYIYIHVTCTHSDTDTPSQYIDIIISNTFVRMCLHTPVLCTRTRTHAHTLITCMCVM